MHRLRYLLLLIPIVFAIPQTSYAQAIYGGRAYSAPVCNSPNCAMCAQIRAQLQAQRASVWTSPPPTPNVSTTAQEYETVQVPVVTQVKRCNGVSCWYESVTTYRTERRPVRRAVKATAGAVGSLLRVTQLVPTPQDAVVAMLKLAAPKRHEVLYDLGCGDGRVLIAATSGYGCRSVGIELNTESFKLAADRIDAFGLADKIRLYQGDVLGYRYDQADIVTMYLYPELMAQVLERLRPGTRVISYLHPIPRGKKYTVDNYTFYAWTVE